MYRTRLLERATSNQRIRLSLLINAAYEFLRRDELDSAKYYLDLVNDSGISEVLLYERHELIICNRTLLDKVIGEVTEGRKTN